MIMTIETRHSGVSQHAKRPRTQSWSEGIPTKRIKRSEATPHIAQKIIEESRRIFFQDEISLLARDRVSQVGLKQLALDRTVYDGINHHYLITVGDKKNVGDQDRSGRCWLFASLNMMRQSMIDKYNLENFEFSQPHLFFWDKYEKVNYFLNLIIKYKSEPTDSESNRSVLNFPSYDGGYWNRFVNLVKKYGMAPKCVMAESFHSSNTSDMNIFMESKCREYARDLRMLHAAGSSIEELMYHKNEILKEVFQVLCVCLGGPPVDKFVWQYEDKDGKVHDTVANHLMLISGVDIKKNSKGEEYAGKWRVENSWGKKRCHEGYFHMSDKWLEENTFHFVIDKSLLTDEHRRAFEEGEVIQVPKWWLMQKVS